MDGVLCAFDLFVKSCKFFQSFLGFFLFSFMFLV